MRKKDDGMIVNTEKPSSYDHLETMSTKDILLAINAEDVTVPVAVGMCIPRIEALVDGIVERMKRGWTTTKRPGNCSSAMVQSGPP